MKHTIIIRLVLFLLLFSLTPFTPGQKALPARTAASNPAIERKINALVARMTLAEKLGQLQQLDGEADGKYRPEHLEMARKGLARFDAQCPRRGDDQRAAAGGA